MEITRSFLKNKSASATIETIMKGAMLFGMSALMFGAALNASAANAANPKATAISTTACVLGDGYVIPNGGKKTVYPVSCGSDCNDYPRGGFATDLFCVNGILGESDPKLTGGPVAPLAIAAQYNGKSACTALPTAVYKQSADRKSCIRR